MSVPNINSFRFGLIVIDGKAYTHDVIIFPDHVQDDWWRIEGHSLAIEDLEEVLKAKPELLIVGQGTEFRMVVPQETRQAVEEAGIEMLAMPTDEACEIYNRQRTEGRVVAALHLTC